MLTGTQPGWLPRVPAQITLYFWCIALLAVASGVSVTDLLLFHFHLGFGLTLAVAFLLSGLVVYAHRCLPAYQPWCYWLTLILVSSLATLITDSLLDTFALPLVLLCLGALVSLGVLLGYWHQAEGGVCIYQIQHLRREVLYWSAILLCLVLGTAIGYLLVQTLDSAYAMTVLGYGGILLTIAIGVYRFKLPAIAAFWMTLIVMQPLATAFANYLAQPPINGGLGWGSLLTGSLFMLVILALVGFVSVRRLDAPGLLREAADTSVE